MPHRRVLGAELAILLGGATNPDSTYPLSPDVVESGSTQLGFAFGGRVGVLLFEHLYLGFELVDYTGSTRYLGTEATPSDSWKAHALQEGGALGWDITYRFLTVRPQLGLGNITFGGPPWLTPADFVTHYVPGHSSSSLYIEPGVTALVGFRHFFVGADIGYLDVTKRADSDFGGLVGSAHAWTAHGQIGVRL